MYLIGVKKMSGNKVIEQDLRIIDSLLNNIKFGVMISIIHDKQKFILKQKLKNIEIKTRNLIEVLK